MTRRQSHDILFSVAVHAARFGVIMAALWIAPLLGITGWYLGLFANAVCCLFAAALITRYRLWKTVGFLSLWRGRTAALLLLVPLGEALMWVFPSGLSEQPPGFGLWAITLLLVGFNEELISRGIVLSRLSGSFGAFPAVTMTALLFGLQHLSLFATSDRGAYDILTNVLMSATYGFALAAFQFRFSWIWPLILIHGLADFTTILTADSHGDLLIAFTAVAFVGYGIFVLRGRNRGGARPGTTQGSAVGLNQKSTVSP